MTKLISFSLDKPVADGDIPDKLNIDWTDFPIREPNTTLKDDPRITITDLKTWESRILEGIQNGFLIHVCTVWSEKFGNKSTNFEKPNRKSLKNIKPCWELNPEL